MKIKSVKNFFVLRLACLFTLIFATSSANAVYWDMNGSDPGAGGSTPSGTWGDGNTNWANYTDTSNANAIDGTANTEPWTPARSAIFSAGSDATGTFTVNVSGTQVATSITFDEGDVTLTGGTLELTNGVVAVGNASGTINSVITNSTAIGLTKNGLGALTLGGANVYAGHTLVTNGVLRLGASGVIPDGSALIVVSTTNNNGFGVGGTATFDLNGYNETVGSLAGSAAALCTVIVALTDGSLTVGGDDTSTTFSGRLEGNGSLIKTGLGTLSLNASNAFSGGVALNQGTLRVNSAYALGVPGSPVTLADGVTFAVTSTTGRTVTNAFVINGNITLGQTVGGTAVLNLGGTVNLAGSPRTITVANASDTISGVISNGGVTKEGTGTLALTGVNTYSGPTTVNSGAIQLNATSTLGDGSGTLTLAGGNLITSAGRANTPIPNPVVLLADTTFTGNTAGAGYRYFPFTGPITTTSGTLTVKNNGTTNGLWTPRFHGSFNFTSPIVMGFGGDTGGVQVASFNTAATGDQTFSGVISGYGSFDRSASMPGTGGKTIFTEANTYTGGTTVGDGTLLVNNTAGSGTGAGPVLVRTNGILGGTGTIAGAVTVNGGGTLSPGTSIGTLTINNDVTLSGNTHIEINKTAGTYDRLIGVNTLAYGGTLIVTNASGILALGDSFPIFSATNYTGSFASIVPATPGDGLAWSLTGGVLSVMAGPPTLQVSQAGNALTFSWTGAFKLQSQTNSFNVGISTNWSDYPGGGTSPVNATIDAANPTVFFRLLSQ